MKKKQQEKMGVEQVGQVYNLLLTVKSYQKYY